MGFSVTTTILATAPIAHYPLNETSGSVASDISGNANHAAYGGTRTLNQASIAADGPSVLFGAAGIVTLPNIDISNRSYAVGGFVRYASLVDVRYFFQAFNSSAAGKNLHSYVTAGGIVAHNYFFDDYNTVTQKIFAATDHYILLRYNAGTDESTIWVNGVLAATGAGKGPLTAAPSLMRFGLDQANGSTWNTTKAQHLTLWRDTIPSNADIAAIWAARANAIDQPPTPAAFTTPVGGESIIGVINLDFPDTVTATSYDFDYSQDAGGSWTPIVAGHGVSGYAFDTTSLADGATLVRVRANNAGGSSAYRVSNSFTVAHIPPGLSFVETGTVDNIVHSAPTLPPRDEGEVAVGAWMTDLVPDAAKWTPAGPRTTRWREGYGFYLPMPGGYARALRQNIKRLRTYGGAMYDGSGTLIEGDPAPPVGSDNMMLLKHAHVAAGTAGIFTTKNAIVCLWMDPVTGSALVYDVGYPASLRFYDGTAHSISGDIVGTLHYPDGSTASGHQPISGSFGSSYDDDLIEIGFSVIAGIVTLYFEPYRVTGLPSTWTVDLSAYISVPGCVAYAMTAQERVGEWRTIRILDQDYIEVTGLQPGWVVKAEQRDFAFQSRRTISATADGSGVARLYGVNPNITALNDIAADSTVTPPDHWIYDWIAVFIDDGSEADRVTDLKNIYIGDVFQWGHLDLPAYMPGVFISPVVDEVIGAVLPQAITITPHVPGHPEAEPVEYQWEFSSDGESWALAQDWQSAATFNWDHHLVAFTRKAQFRARARGTTSLIPSGWRYSDVFVVYHLDGDLVADDVAPDDIVTKTAQFSAYLKPATSPAGHASTHWRVYDEDALVIDLVVAGADRAGLWITGLSEAHRYQVDYAFIDYLDNEGPFSARRDFWTLRLSMFEPHTADDIVADSYGDYINVAGGFIDGTTAGMPEIVSGGGARLNTSGIDFEQTPAEFPDQTHHMIRMHAVGTAGYHGVDYREGFTTLLICTPLNVSTPRELMGQPGGIIVWHDNIGRVNVTVVMQIEPDFHIVSYGDGSIYTSGNTTYPSGGTIEKDVMQCIFLGGRSAWYNTELALLEPSGTPVEYRVPRSPDVEVKNLEVWMGVNGSWKITLPVNVFNGTIPVSDKFLTNATRQMMWDIGHGSTNADAADDLEADGRFAQMIPHAFVYWDRLLDAVDVDAIAALVAAEDVAGALAYIAAMDPQPISVVPFKEYPRPTIPTIAVP